MKKNLIKSLTTLLIATVAISTAVILPKRDVDAATENELIRTVCNIAKWEERYSTNGDYGNKYGAWINKYYPDLYWGDKTKVAWCDVFVDWCMIQAFGYENACKITNQGKGYDGKRDNRGGAKTYYKYDSSNDHNSEAYYKQMGRLLYPKDTSPRKGDQVFFTYEHTGLIVGSKLDGRGNIVYSVAEGNTGKQVKINEYTGTGSFRSFGRPNYASLQNKNITLTTAERHFVNRVYYWGLDRKPDASGLNYWVNNLSAKKITAADVVKGIIGSQEFTNQNVSKDAAVNRLYRAVLNREPDQGGKNYWVSVYNPGNRLPTVRGFVNNGEFSGICKEVLGITPGSL